MDFNVYLCIYVFIYIQCVMCKVWHYYNDVNKTQEGYCTAPYGF